LAGLFTALCTTAGFILGVRVGFALARRGEKRPARKRQSSER
jgi:hypothetical protein